MPGERFWPKIVITVLACAVLYATGRWLVPVTSCPPYAECVARR
jgi:hypothetical protein